MSDSYIRNEKERFITDFSFFAGYGGLSRVAFYFQFEIIKVCFIPLNNCHFNQQSHRRHTTKIPTFFKILDTYVLFVHENKMFTKN